MGFVGMNISELKYRIKEYELTVQRALDVFYEGGNLFFEYLGKSWYSPNAVSFSNIYGSRLYNSTVTDVLNFINDYSNRFIFSCNIMAHANGVLEQFEEPVFQLKGSEFPSLKEAGPSGEVGMDISSLTSIVQNYHNTLQQGLELLENVRVDFPLYSSDESIQNAMRVSYNALIDKIKLSYKETMQALLNEINSNQNNLQTSAAQAASTIQGSGSAS